MRWVCWLTFVRSGDRAIAPSPATSRTTFALLVSADAARVEGGGRVTLCHGLPTAVGGRSVVAVAAVWAAGLRCIPKVAIKQQ